MLRNILKSVALFIFIVLSLVACSSVTPAGLIAASRLDPLGSNASDIAVAVGVPESIRLEDGDAQFEIAFTSEAETLSETILLQVQPGADEGPAPNEPGEMVYIARFSPEDAARVTATQARIKALKAAGIDGSGSITISVVDGCTTTPPIVALPVSTWLQTDPDAAFVRLTRRQDMLTVLNEDDARAFADGFRPCP